MRRYVVDTNVPIVANGRADPKDGQVPSINCRIAAITFLKETLASGKILIDLDGAIQAEYHRHLNPRGQPGVGDRFYQAVLNSSPKSIERIAICKRPDGEYVNFPQELIEANFDPSDRKFVALSVVSKAPVVNSTDSDWLNHRRALEKHGVHVKFLCGFEKKKWFEKK